MKQLFLLSFLVSGIVFAQKKQTDWERFDLKGKVKFVETSTYDVVEVDGQIKEKKLSVIEFGTREYFNDFGYLVKVENFDEKQQKFVDRYERTYNKKRKIVADKQFEEGKLERKTNWTYAKNGYKVEQVRFHPNEESSGEKRVKEFDKKGNELSHISYDENGEKVDSWVNTYSKKRKRTESSLISAYPAEYGSKAVYSYDKKGNIIRLNRFSEEGELCQWTIYKYDKNNNLLEETTTLSSGEIHSKEAYKYNSDNKITEIYSRDKLAKMYVYDKFGNKTEEIHYKDEEVCRKRFYTYNSKQILVEKTEITKDGTNKDIYEIENKNWIKKMEYKDGVLRKITERKIEYY